MKKIKGKMFKRALKIIGLPQLCSYLCKFRADILIIEVEVLIGAH